MSYAKNFLTLEDAKPDFPIVGSDVWLHKHDVAKMFRLYDKLCFQNEKGDIDAGSRLIKFKQKLISWEDN